MDQGGDVVIGAVGVEEEYTSIRVGEVTTVLCQDSGGKVQENKHELLIIARLKDDEVVQRLCTLANEGLDV